MKYLIANWKAHKNIHESVAWVNQLNSSLENDLELKQLLQTDQVKIIICPSTPALAYVKQLTIQQKNIEIGIQNVSEFEEGSYTGEVTASMIKGLAQYAVVGHSERRKFMGESESSIEKKIQQLNKNDIASILCIRNQQDPVYATASLVAYEPEYAIGSGNNMDLSSVEAMKENLHLHESQKFIYGGSVNSQDCLEYFKSKGVDGFLIGKASLDATEFISIFSQLKLL